MSNAKRRLDRQNAQRSQAMAREAAQVLADEKVRLEGVALTRPHSNTAADRRMNRPVALDLYCCQGGASSGLAAAGFQVVGVDIVPQPNYPFPFIRADAITTLPTGFDFVWASPPCQAHTLAQRIRGREHPDLIEPTRAMLRAAGIPYVIENVVGAPLENPVLLCGAMFGIQTYRHRLFECSFPIDAPWHPDHTAPIRKMGRPVRDGEMMHIVGNFSGVQTARDIMDAQWMNRDGLREAIPPVFAQYIGEAALASMTERRTVSSPSQERNP